MKHPQNLIIAGRPGVGKTTLIKKLLQELPPGKVAGFYTEEIRVQGKRKGFLAQVIGGQRTVLATTSVPGPYRVGRYTVKVEEFEQVVVQELRAALRDPSKVIFVIDEIGKMELLAPSFAGLVFTCLADPRPLIATTMSGPHPLVDRLKARPDVRTIVLTEKNRDGLGQELPAMIKATLLGPRLIDRHRAM